MAHLFKRIRWRFLYSLYSFWYSGQLTCSRPDRILVERAMSKFNKATDILKDHSKTQSHSNAMKDMARFTSVMEQKELPVDQMLHSALAMQIEKNRIKLKSILKTVVLCGKQSIPLRGHRDDAKYLNDETVNSGNFQALLDFRIDAGDEILQQHFLTAPRNATYRSKTIQNELIESVAKWIRQNLVTELYEAKYFTVLADETTDISYTEQLSLVLRFVDAQQHIREEFMEFVEAPSTTGQAIAQLILQRIALLGLDSNLIRGQGYDGAGNMAGIQRGAAALIQQQYPLALYSHCSSHILNLCIVKACTVQTVRNALGAISAIASFFNQSAKRQEFLEQQIAKVTVEVHIGRRSLVYARQDGLNDM